MFTYNPTNFSVFFFQTIVVCKKHIIFAHIKKTHDSSKHLQPTSHYTFGQKSEVRLVA